jgi:hypothetical protein
MAVLAYSIVFIATVTYQKKENYRSFHYSDNPLSPLLQLLMSSKRVVKKISGLKIGFYCFSCNRLRNFFSTFFVLSV